MTVGVLVPLIAAILCFETAVVFGLLYTFTSRRAADRVFSGLAAALGVMCLGSVITAQPEPSLDRLFGLRVQYAGAFASMTLFLHFAALAAGERPRPVELGWQYLLGGTLMILSLTPLYLRPNPASDGLPFVTGSLYRPLTPLLVFGVSYAWWKLWRGARREPGEHFAPLEAHLPFILAGLALLIGSAALVVAIVLFFPGVRLPFSPHALAAAILCVLTAVALGRELLRSQHDKRRLREAVAFRDRAVREVAHELKNPLAGLQTALTSLLALELDPAARQEMVGLCAETCRRLLRLLNNMLDTARLEAGREVDLRWEEVDLAALAETVIEGHRGRTTAHVLRLDNRLDQPRVRADGDKLHQVLGNLVDNAIKYSPDGGEVTVTLTGANGQVELAVADRGIGMTEEQQARLFEPFSRVVDPERKITGTGIGLHLVKHLVELHGGRLAVESAPGEGSTFRVALPR